MQACDNTLSTAADLLSQVKERSVLKELFNSTTGINKAQDTGMHHYIYINNHKICVHLLYVYTVYMYYCYCMAGKYVNLI